MLNLIVFICHRQSVALTALKDEAMMYYRITYECNNRVRSFELVITNPDMEESKIDILIHASVRHDKKQAKLDKYIHVMTHVEFSIDRQLWFIVHDRTIH